MHWWLHFFGLDSASGPAYLAWSGAISDLSLVTLLAGLLAFLHHRNCHVKGCYRLGRHPAAGGQFTTCRKHSPEPAVREGLSAAHIHSRHREHLSRQADGGTP